MDDEPVLVGGSQIARMLYDFVNDEVLPGTNTTDEWFWAGAETISEAFLAKNRLLLQKRDDLQAKVDEWHRSHPHGYKEIANYKAFLLDIGYWLPDKEHEKISISTTNVDDEIARKAGPQLVVPLMNARFAQNAANGRWGSLYDALYGTNANELLNTIRNEESSRRLHATISQSSYSLEQYGLFHSNVL